MKYCIIGSGIIGSAIAREIALRGIGDVEVIEKEEGLGKHASGRNSEVIHSGINQKPGTYKAKFCLEGSKMLREYCLSHGVPMEECGTIVTANSEKEIEALNHIYNLGKQVGVPGIRIISKSELTEREPYAKGLEALLSPSGAILDSKSLLEEVMEDAVSAGAIYSFGEKVLDISGGKIITEKSEINADKIINCTGLNADRIAHIMGVGKDYFIIPIRGDYLQVPLEVSSMIYQVPDLRFPFLGVHLTKKVNGGVIAGPTASLSLGGREDYDRKKGVLGLSEMICEPSFWRWGIDSLLDQAKLEQIVYNVKLSNSQNFFVEEIEKIYSGPIDSKKISPYRSGIRAQLVNSKGIMIDDFLIEETENSIHVLNTVSPGLTSSLAFAKHIVDKYIEKK